MVKSMCFLLGGRRFKSIGGNVCTPLLTLAVKSVHRRGPLSHKQGGLIHQIGVSLGGNLKNRLLLLLYEVIGDDNRR